MISESKATLIVITASLVAYACQAWYAREANSFNKEQITIAASSSDNPSDRIGETTCWAKDMTTIALNWTVTVFNNSTQPITIKEFDSIATTSAGPTSSVTISPTGPIGPKFPVLIEAKSFKTFKISLPSRTSLEFGKWFRENGGCAGKPIWPSALGRQRFDETGWEQSGNSGAMFTAVSAGGNKFSTQAVWR